MATQTATEEVKHADPVMREKLNEAFADATSPIEYNGPNIFQVLTRAFMIAFSAKAAEKDKSDSGASTGADAR